MTIARHLTIHGRVQGVFYRASAVEAARKLGLVGWVRNRRGGTVEALVQGDEAAVQQFIGWASEGPPHADVERVDAEESEYDPALTGFTQAPTL
jgi:acylphosphatase